MLDGLDIGPLGGGERWPQEGPWVGPLPACRAIIVAMPAAAAAVPLVRKY